MFESEAGLSSRQWDLQRPIIERPGSSGRSSEKSRWKNCRCANRETSRAAFALAFITVLVSSCGEREAERQPGYQYGLAEGRSIGHDEGREEMKAEMCAKTRTYDDRIHSALQHQRICD